MESGKKTPLTDLITGAGGFLGKYFMHLLATTDDNNRRKTVTLGIDPGNDIVCDLTAGPPQLTDEISTVYHLAGSCFDSGNSETINVTATENLLRGLEANAPRNLVFISSVEIYGRTEGSDLTEATIPEPTSPTGKSKLHAEDILSKWCADRDVTLTVLRCAPIVGTGMKGPLREMVNSIYRGTYNHIAGNDARLSVVHAVDVARAAIEIAPAGGTYNLTDGINPSRHDLAEAFSTRMNHKRVYTISLKRASRLARICDFIPFAKFGSDELKRRMTTLTFSSDKIISRLGWKPNSVTEYLTTHVYDETSL